MSISKHFKEVREKYPLLSSFEIFVKAVRKEKYTQVQIRKAFTKLVNKSDYDTSEKKELIKWLSAVSRGI